MKKNIFAYVMIILILFTACSQQGAQPIMPSVVSNEADLAKLGEQYLNPAFYASMTSKSWGKVSEIDADKLVMFYVWAGRHESFDFAIPENLHVSEDKDEFVSADIVELEIQKYFNINSEYMRDSEYYNAETKTYMIAGLGGASSCEVVNVTSSGDIIEIEFNGYQDGEFYQTGKLSIKANGDTYRYYSCHVNDEI